MGNVCRNKLKATHLLLTEIMLFGLSVRLTISIIRLKAQMLHTTKRPLTLKPTTLSTIILSVIYGSFSQTYRSFLLCSLLKVMVGKDPNSDIWPNRPIIFRWKCNTKLISVSWHHYVKPKMGCILYIILWICSLLTQLVFLTLHPFPCCVHCPTPPLVRSPIQPLISHQILPLSSGTAVIIIM